jgi:hypothetical protein
MITENKKDIIVLEIQPEIPVKVTPIKLLEPEIPDLKPVEVIEPITYVQKDDYNEAMNSLVAKYSKK